MKPMLSRDFRAKVHMIPESSLRKFLKRGYEDYLPNELTGGRASTSVLVRDYCRWERAVDKAIGADGKGNSDDTSHHTSSTTGLSQSNPPSVSRKSSKASKTKRKGLLQRLRA